MFGPTRGFSGMADSMEPCNMLHGSIESIKWIESKITKHKLNRFNGTMQHVVGPTLVAMATKFELGAEIQSPTGL